jgi:hypothetical protein
MQSFEGKTSAKLLKALFGSVVAEQIIENGEDVLAVAENLFQAGAQLRLFHGFAIPLGKHGGGNLDIAAQLLGRMAAQKETVEKGGFTLRELEVLQRLFHRSAGQRIGLSGHGRKGSLQIWTLASRAQAL